MKIPRIIAVLLVVLSVSGFPLAAQTTEPPQGTYSATINVGYISVPFVVRDRRGTPVRNLKKDDVTLLVDGQPVVTDIFVSGINAPVSYTILLDGSGSMALAGKMNGARAAIRELLAQRLPGDDFSLHVFARGEVNEVVPFTSDARKIMDALGTEPWGKTAFFDALALVRDQTVLGRNRSRAIVLLTDGLDNASQLTKSELATVFQGVDVPVYPLGLREPPVAGRSERASPEAMTDLEVLAYVATISGGRIAVETDPAKLREAIRKMNEDLRAQYTIGFSPTGQGAVKYRKFSIKVRGSGRSVRAREGYMGLEPPYASAREARKSKGRSSSR